jgi:hypothetical protein
VPEPFERLPLSDNNVEYTALLVGKVLSTNAQKGEEPPVDREPSFDTRKHPMVEQSIARSSNGGHVADGILHESRAIQVPASKLLPLSPRPHPYIASGNRF